MYARITPYKMKPGARDDAVGIMNSLKDQILALPGMTRFINVIDGDGKGYVVALTTQPEMTEDMAAKVSALWSNFAEQLETKPAPERYEVVADWS